MNRSVVVIAAHPDDEAINLRFNLRCDHLEANGKTQAQAIAIATREIYK